MIGRALLLFVAIVSGCDRTPSYEGIGDLMAVDRASLRVTIRHDDIPNLMPAMTMAFGVRSPDVLASAAVGTRVSFKLVQRGDDLVVTRLVPLSAAGGPRPGIHDHTPHHGGVVAMVGMRHLEASASSAGHVAVYLTDVWRRPLPLDDVVGAVTLDLPDGRRALLLEARDGVLEATGPPLTGTNVLAHVRLEREGEPIETHFVLPLTGSALGAAEVTLTGCAPPESRQQAGERVPRCTLRFSHAVTFIAATPDEASALIGVAGAGVTAWSMPAGRFLLGFEPAPAIAVPVDAPPHTDSATAIAASPDGRETAVATENRLLVYSTASGRFMRELPSFRGALRDLAWSPDGTHLLASVFYDDAAFLLDADGKREPRRLTVEREGAAVAFSPDARRAAVGSEMGPIAVFDLAAGPPPVLLHDSPRAANALAFSGEHLVSAGADGVVRWWNLATGAVAFQSAAGGFLLRLALAPDGRLAASAGLDHTIHLYDLATGTEVEALAWHESAVWGLAWAGRTLVSGDADGSVALWDLADRLDAPRQ